MGFVQAAMFLLMLAPAGVKSGPVFTVSTGAAFRLESALAPEQPTVVVFYQETSAADKAMVDHLSEQAQQSGKVGLRLVRLKGLGSPAARAYDIRETPTAMVLDRFGKLLVRTSRVDEVDEAVGRAERMARIKWVDEQDPDAPRVYRMLGGGQRPVAGILKSMSLRPELMEGMNRIAGMAHFTEGYLPVRTKEMIATYVSAINHCKF